MSTPPPRSARAPSALPSVLLAALAVAGLLGAAVSAATLSGAPALGLHVTGSDAKSITVAWTYTAPGPQRFGVYRDGTLVAATPLHQFTFGGLECGTTHHLGVTAFDARSNAVAQAAVDATTAVCTQPQPQPQPQPGQDPSFPALPARSLDGSGDNLFHTDWGQAGTQYERMSRPNYADGTSALASGPSPRRISNRVFNDLGQNLFSENGVSQWGWAWGQFIDHDMDLRDERAAEPAPMPFDASDPLESFANEVGQLDFARTPAAPGTGPGTSRPRQQINTISSFLDASQVYGTQDSRLQWLRVANSPDLLLPGGYLPRADARGDAASAPAMDLMGALAGNPPSAIVAGDVRANENLALTSLQTLFAREHNRIADSLPASLGNDVRFQIARRVVGAEIQFITYNEFLPALGVRLDGYRGYNPHVDPSITNEFATVGFRAHSMVHGEFEPTATYTSEQLAAFAAQGIAVEPNGDGTATLVIPLGVSFGNPGLVQQVGLGPALASLDEREYANDEQIDNSMRSVLFQVPKPGVTDPAACGEPVVSPDCFSDVADLAADDVQRGRDHGMPSYNRLRRAYGLPPVRSFTAITGESTDAFPAGMSCDDPGSIAFVSLRDQNGNSVALGDQEDATAGTRGSTLAARLKCLYGDVDSIDAFVGMVAEQHVPGTEFGPLQLGIWRRQFTALRDGDRFFYGNDPALRLIQRQFGISFQHTLAEIVALNTGESLPATVFKPGP